jgi:ligand-binding SRPBCC domain-containing protein
MSYTLERQQSIRRPLAEVFAFYAEPGNLALITPRWLGFRIVTPGALAMRRGLTIEYRVHPLGVPQRWVSEITEYDPPHRFVDEQRHGPYASWHHEHRFAATSTGGTLITDRVTYALPFGPLGRIAHALLVRRQLESIFDYRDARVAAVLGGP